MLARLCSSKILARDRHRGEGYYRSDHVGSLDWDDNVVYADVYGSQPEPYAVELDFSEIFSARRITVFCTCPRFGDGFFCKHIWATLLTVDHQHREAAWGSSAVSLVRSDAFGSSETSPPPESWEGSTRSWKTRLQRIQDLLVEPLSQRLGLSQGAGRAYYFLNRHAPGISSGLLLDLYQRQPLQNGELGKLKRLSLTAENISAFESPEDQEVLGMLLATPDPRLEIHGAYSYSSYHQHSGRQRALIPEALAELLLPRLAATGRFFSYDGSQGPDLAAAQLLKWDPGPPWRLDLRLETGEGDSFLKGRLVREQEECSLKRVRMLLDVGFILLEEDTVEDRPAVAQWSRLEVTPAQAWLWELTLGGEIRIPAAQLNDFLGDLWQLPSPEVVHLPERLRLEPTTLEPKPILSLRPARTFHRGEILEATVSFEYEGRVVELEDGLQDGPASWADVEARKVILRNRAFERAAFENLRQKGFLIPRHYRTPSVHLEIIPETFLNVVAELLEEGFKVEGEKGAFRRPTTSRFQVSSDIDWFTVEGALSFGDQEVVLPELLRGLQDGNRLVRLGDGSTGVLPEAWYQRLQELGDLSSGRSSGGLRYSSSQALLLDALLSVDEGTEVRKAVRFRQLQEQMTALAKVGPAREPRGFRGELRPYQRVGLGWLKALAKLGLGGCLADDMGLGKTIEVLALLQSRRFGRKKQDRRPSLAVVPKTLVHNWIDEARRFTPGLEVFEWTGKDRGERWEKAGPVDLIVTTYGTLRRDIETLRTLELDYAILDEAQAIKNAKSQTAKACRLLPAPHRLALTGTPVENSLADLWSIFEFLNPGMLGRSQVFLNIIKSRSVTQKEADLLRRVLSPFILRRTKEEVLPDLPAKTEQILLCDLDTTERRLYDQLRGHYHRLLKQKIKTVGIQRSKIHVLEALLRLRQAACHPGLLNPAQGDRKGSKIQLLLDHLQDAIGAGHKSLVFSQFTSFLALVRRHLDDLSIPYVYLDGRTRNRKERVETFQTDPTIPVFLISLKAGGSGLNLTAADYVFLLDPWWNPAVERQAIDRTHRIGQTRPVLAYRLIASETVEEKVLKLQDTKRQLAEAILTQDTSVLRQLTQEDLEFLLS